MISKTGPCSKKGKLSFVLFYDVYLFFGEHIYVEFTCTLNQRNHLEKRENVVPLGSLPLPYDFWKDYHR